MPSSPLTALGGFAMSKRAGSRPPADRPGSTRPGQSRLEAAVREAAAHEAPDRDPAYAEKPAREAPARDASGLEAAVSHAAVHEEPVREAESAQASGHDASALEEAVSEASGRQEAVSYEPLTETPAAEAPEHEAPAREAETREAQSREAEARQAVARAREAEAREAQAREAREAREIEARKAAAREADAREARAREAKAPATPVREAAASAQPQRPGQPTPPARPQTTPPEAAKPDRPRPVTIKPSRVEPGRPKLSPVEPLPTDSAPPSANDNEPPWSQVIATTLQLWLGRRLRGGRDTLARPARRSRRWIGAIGLAIVVFAAGALTIALVQNNNGGRPAASNGGHAHTGRTIQPVKLSGPALQAAARNRQQAAAWIAAQVSHAAIVSCDPVMCQALTAARFPAGNLLPLGPSATDPMGSDLVVDTTVLRNQLGSRLQSIYAPAVLASFGSGETGVSVRIEAPDGGSAYLVAQRADLLARQQDGQQLVGSRSLHLAAGAQQSIAAGEVDSRLLATLVALLGQHFPVYVYRFGDQGPGASPGVPMRMMRIAALAQSGHGASSYQHLVQHFLAQQQPPYRASVSVLHLSGAKTVIQIEFSAPSPLGLLGAHSGQ